jgi:UDP-2-acetamido-2,6-beta-L-arabino-hexul-4-ose reductase
LDNPYGVSKRQAEEILQSFSRSRGCPVVIFRLQNAFGKWCRPNYNSVTATFCHNIAHDLPLTISDPNRELELVYIDDIIAMFLAVLDTPPEPGQCEFRQVKRSFKVTLGGLAARIRSFRESRRSVVVPSFEDEFTKFLYATYLSYLDGPQFVYELEQKTDQRGSLAEFMKAASFGQVFVSRTKPGVTRGNHFHHTKAEKFLVVEGEAVIRFRHVLNGPVIEHRVSGKDFRVLDIPPGYTHSIENVGTGEMVVLFWASEAFDPQRPDTYALPVQ